MSTEPHDRDEFERAIATTRRFVAELEKHCDPELVRTAMLAVALEVHELEHGREQLTAWLAQLSTALAAEFGAEIKH